MRILLHPLLGGRKIAQIGQTEPEGVPNVRREVKFVQNIRHKLEGIRHLANSFLKLCIILTF